jgi:tetratricopeptide (TPR) repeat protein
VQRAVIEFSSRNQPDAEMRRVGPYRLIRELGRGGMGAVYLAARDDEHYESEVAIKLVQPGLDTDFILRRFRRERQILASLQHPNIAKLFDGGTADDGAPYLVMEYIQGSWITKYAAENDLSIEQRLRLFLPVCAAVEYAHRHFIVHRDLKPGNILIDATGSPKLLDFGISKLVHSGPSDPGDTQGIGMLTPDYASPEQILGNPVTVLSDVYSLGAVLYELLTGVRPHRIEQCTPLALERAICIEETAPPSVAARGNPSLARRFKGDLDNIVLRAMQKEPERRYASVDQMADDIRRCLDHLPVTARRDSFAYRTSKFIRRNRLAVTLAAMVVVALIAGAAIAMREARIATRHAEEVRRLATTFVFDVEEAARELPGSLPVRQLITRTSLEHLGNLARSSASDWTLKRELATAYLRIGEIQGGVETANLGDTAGALKSFREAQDLLDAVLKHSPSDRKAILDRMTVSHRTSNLHRQMGQVGPATAATEDGLQRADALLARNDKDMDAVQYGAVFHLDLGRLRQQAGDLGAAANHISTGIRLLERLSAARPEERETISNLAASQARLGAVQAELGHRQQALDSYRAGVSHLEELDSRTPNNVYTLRQLMLAYAHVGDTLGNPTYDNFDDQPGARAAYSRMVEVAKKLHTADANDVRAISDYGIALLRLGIVSLQNDKKVLLRQAEAFLQRASARNPKDSPTRVHKAWTEVEFGDVLLTAGDRSGAARFYRMAIATVEAGEAIEPTDSSSQRWLVMASGKLAAEQARSGDRPAAEATLEKALQLVRRNQSAAPASLSIRSISARALQMAGSVYAILAEREAGQQRNRDRETARDWYRRSMEEWRKLEMLEGFTMVQKKEMQLAAAELASLETQLGGAR